MAFAKSIPGEHEVEVGPFFGAFPIFSFSFSGSFANRDIPTSTASSNGQTHLHYITSGQYCNTEGNKKV